MTLTFLTILAALFGIVVYMAIGVEAMRVYCRDAAVLNVQMAPWKEIMSLLVWPAPVIASILRSGILAPEMDKD